MSLLIYLLFFHLCCWFFLHFINLAWKTDEDLYHIHCGASGHMCGIFVLNMFMFLLTSVSSLSNHEMFLFFYCSICFSSFLILFGCLPLFFYGYFGCIALWVSPSDCYREVFSECYRDLGTNLKRENRLRGFDDWCLIEKLNRNRLNMGLMELLNMVWWLNLKFAMSRRSHAFYIYWSGETDIIKVFKNQYDTEVTIWSPTGRFF